MATEPGLGVLGGLPLPTPPEKRSKVLQEELNKIDKAVQAVKKVKEEE